MRKRQKLRLVLPNHPGVVLLGLLSIPLGIHFFETIRDFHSLDQTCPLTRLFMTGVAAFVTLSMMSGMRGSTIDLRRRHLFRWWGFYIPLGVKFPFWFQFYKLDNFDRVYFGRKIRIIRGDEGSYRYTVYTVQLVGAERRVAVYMSLSQRRARRCAERVAEFLRFSLEEENRGCCDASSNPGA